MMMHDDDRDDDDNNDDDDVSSRYCFKDETQARDFQRCRPHLSTIIEFKARVGYVKKISAAIVSGQQPSSDEANPMSQIGSTPMLQIGSTPMSQIGSPRRANSGPSALELIYNYSHYMYGALWVADDAVDGERGTVRCKRWSARSACR